MNQVRGNGSGRVASRVNPTITFHSFAEKSGPSNGRGHDEKPKHPKPIPNISVVFPMLSSNINSDV